MPNIQNVSEAAITKAQEILKAGIRKDITSASGAAAYDLQPVAILLQPVITPLRNAIPRITNKRGGTVSEWRIISALLSGKFDPTVSAEGAQGNKLNYSFTPTTMPFAELAVRDSVTWSAEDAAKGFEDDLHARAVTNTLFALMIQEEQQILFGRVNNLSAAPSSPTSTTATTGGTIAAATYHPIVRAITGAADGTNNRGRKSTAGSQVTTGSTSTITLSTPYVEGAVQYEWWVDGAGDNTNWTLQAITGINSITLTALTNTGTGAPPADNVANSLGYTGLINQLASGSGAYVQTQATGTAGVGTDFALTDIDAANKAVWDQAKGDPETIYMNSTQLVRATNLVLEANGAPTLFVQAESQDMAALTGGFALAKYVNKSTGRLQQVRVHPYLPDGTMLAFSRTIPFPTGGDTVGVDIETSRDYQQVDYALTARRYDFEVYLREVLRMKFPGGAWVIRNIKSNPLG